MVDGQPTRTGLAFPIGALRLTSLVLLVVLLVVYHDLITLLLVDTMLRFLPLVLLGVVASAVLARFGGGCLPHLLGGALTAGLGRPRNSPDGWDLIVETDDGQVAVRLAAALPLSEGDEVVVWGPNVAGTKHAWAFRRVGPSSAFRLGRGLVSTVLGLALMGGALVLPYFG